jgi:hypothetical protein
MFHDLAARFACRRVPKLGCAIIASDKDRQAIGTESGVRQRPFALGFECATRNARRRVLQSHSVTVALPSELIATCLRNPPA